MTWMLALAAVLSTVVSSAPRRTAIEEVTEERVRQAYVDARAAVLAVLGLEIDAKVELRIVEPDVVGRRVAEENLPAILLRQPDERKAKLEAAAMGSAFQEMAMAKYSWSSRELLVVPERWNVLARALGRPELTSDATMRALLVHELIHAIDDAAHGFAATIARLPDVDASTAFSAVVEGHAQYQTRKVCEARGWLEGFEVFTASIGAVAPSAALQGEAALMMMRVQAATIASTYYDGERFIAALARSEQKDAIARAFRDPPRDADTIVHPDWFLDPSKRPRILHDLEPALDLVSKRFDAAIWSSQRISIQPAQLEVSLSMLPAETSKAVRDSLRASRMIVLQPTAAPTSKMVVFALMEFDGEASARRYLAAARELGRIKDETMTSGLVRILESRTSEIDGDLVDGFMCHKKMANGALEFAVETADVAQGRIVFESVFSGEPIEVKEHAELALAALGAVRKLEQAEASR